MLRVEQLLKVLLTLTHYFNFAGITSRKNEQILNNKDKRNVRTDLPNGKQICFFKSLNSFMTEVPILS